MLFNLLDLLRTELAITILVFVLLFFKLKTQPVSARKVGTIVYIGLLAMLVIGFLPAATGSAFDSMFSTTNLIRFEKNLLLAATLIILMLSEAWIHRHAHAVEFYIIMLCCLLGMCFMVSSANLLMFYLGLELSSIPLAALVCFDLKKRSSSEAAFKMVVSAAFASACLLFGISWLYGLTGTLSFAEIPGALDGSGLQTFAFVLVFSGFAFKISAVPFHLWTADVYQGAPTGVTAFLSVASKASVLFVLLTILQKVFHGFEQTTYQLLLMVSVTTMVVGNLFALRQQNFKRFMAFSSIAQVGFILVGLCGQSSQSATALVFFLLVYLFSNLAVFGVIQLVEQSTGHENIDDYRQFVKSNPVLAWTLAIALFSLAGIPPTAGFFGKFFLLLAGAGKANWVLLSIAALNMVVSLYYYLRVIRAMFMDEQEYPIEKIAVGSIPKMALVFCMAGIIITGLFGGGYGYIASLIQP